MAMQQTDRKKAAALVGLVVVAGIVAYLRFYRGRPGVSGGPGGAGVAAVGAELPPIDLEQYRIGAAETTAVGAYAPLARDLFSLDSLARRPTGALRHVPGPTDSLPPVRPRLPSRNALPEVTGIMRRGGQAFAIINKRMVQEGEQIFGYTVREIGRTTVTLRDASGDTVIQVTK
jgi:hypothetical protein